MLGRLDVLAGFTGEGPGVTRLVYDPAWNAAHGWLAAQARALGLAATADWAGNLFFHDPSFPPGRLDRPALLVGSHLDTVVHGGRLDGAFGTVAGLLLAAAARGQGGMPVVGFVTAEEEGSRFHVSLAGARTLLGLIGPDDFGGETDARGIAWKDALGAVRAAGQAAALPLAGVPPPLFRPGAMLELHIEQGPVLEAEGLALGIVESIAGYRRWRARLRGEARHAGTTPMTARHDALAAAAEMVLAAEALAHELGPPAVATAGFVRAEPGLFNVVPGACELFLETRHAEPEALRRMNAELESRCRAVAARRQVDVELQVVAEEEPTALSPALAGEAERLAVELGIPPLRMASGAAHDAMVFARAGVPALMLFVPSWRGISHAPDEHTDPEHLVAGYRFAAELVRRLAARGEPITA